MPETVSPVVRLGQFLRQTPDCPGPLSLHWNRRPGTRAAEYLKAARPTVVGCRLLRLPDDVIRTGGAGTAARGFFRADEPAGTRADGVRVAALSPLGEGLLDGSAVASGDNDVALSSRPIRSRRRMVKRTEQNPPR
jgi:hypothetical protein